MTKIEMVEERADEVSLNRKKRRWDLVIRVVASVVIFSIIGAMIYAAVLDVRARIRARQEQILLEVENCRKAYAEAECAPETRRQALEEFCAKTERCINRNPFEVHLHTANLGRRRRD